MVAPASDMAMDISTHALREEGDGCVFLLGALICEISTHALREESHRPPSGMDTVGTVFLPTPSARRATRLCTVFSRSISAISTHALREEGDHLGHDLLCRLLISTHALREEGDIAVFGQAAFKQISTHALREEGVLIGGRHRHDHRNFYPRPPRGGRPE